uniref:DDE Tnp4 domain-containing protein n=1 Tax=Loa loa TaxID=7209 RepID=A0A1I7VML6_LOALO
MEPLKRNATNYRVVYQAFIATTIKRIAELKLTHFPTTFLRLAFQLAISAFQSILQRCCIISVPRKLYIGTDLVSVGSYYTGGTVDLKDLYSREGPEFDFVSNVRTEQYDLEVFRVISTN